MTLFFTVTGYYVRIFLNDRLLVRSDLIATSGRSLSFAHDSRGRKKE